MPSRPTTILYVAWAPFFSGAERALLILTEHLDRTKYRPLVIVGTDGKLAVELKAKDICTHVIPIAYLGARQLSSWARCIARIGQVARKERAAVVHANDLPSFQPGGYVGRILRRPTLCHVRFPD